MLKSSDAVTNAASIDAHAIKATVVAKYGFDPVDAAKIEKMVAFLAESGLDHEAILAKLTKPEFSQSL